MDSQWFLGRDGQQYGPYTWDELRAHVADGRIKGKDLVWAAHLPGYVPAKRIQGLMPEKRAAKLQASPPVVPPAVPFQTPPAAPGQIPPGTPWQQP
jgi:hypothetical protein